MNKLCGIIKVLFIYILEENKIIKNRHMLENYNILADRFKETLMYLNFQKQTTVI